MKNTKKSVIVSAILAIAMCVSLAVGGTLALFTSSSKVNIAVTSANVDVATNVTVAEKWHKDGGATVTGSLYDTGSVEVANGSKQVDVTLKNFVPTDGVKLNVSLTNNSTVKVKYRVILSANRESGTELLDALKISMNGKEFRGYTLASEFTALDAETSPEPVSVTIEFPEDATEGMNMSCNLTIKVEAQQGNAVALNTFEVADGHTVIAEEVDGVNWYSEVDNATLLEEVKNGAKLSGNLTLTENVDLDTTLVVADNTSVEITTDKTITNTVDVWDESTGMWSLISARGANTALTINGGEWKAKEDDCYTVDIQDGANVVIKDGNFIGNITAVYVYEGSLTIEGGFFDIQQLNTNGEQDGYGLLINCYDSNHKNGTAKITITGGTFVNFNPADNKAEGEGTNFVADGYEVISEQHGEDTWYKVCKVVSTAEDLKETFANGKNVKLGSDIETNNGADTVAAKLSITKPTTLNFGDYKLKSPNDMGNNYNNFAALFVFADTIINANANGGIDTGINGGYGISVRNGAKLTINGGYYYGGGTAVQVEKGELEINGGFFACEPYSNPIYGYNFLINCIDDAYKNGTAKIIVKGGTFVNFNPANCTAEGAGTNFVADGYHVEVAVQENGDVWYTVENGAVTTVSAVEGQNTAEVLSEVFKTAESGKSLYVALKDDVTIDTLRALNGTTNDGVKDIVIDANGHTIKTEKADGSRCVRVESSTVERTYTLMNAKIVCTATTASINAGEQRGQQIYEVENATINLVNCTVEMTANNFSYLVKVIGGKNLTVNIKGCTLTGANCIEVVDSSDCTFNITDCVLNSNYPDNTKYVGEGIQDKGSRNNTYNVKNCTFNGGNAEPWELGAGSVVNNLGGNVYNMTISEKA